jgi:DNA (cytosine-5)-methyltransferase 1
MGNLIKHRHTFIDCFAGAGGLSLGLKRAGFEPGAAFDIDSDAVKTYERNIGSHIVHADVTSIQGSQLLEVAGIERGMCSLVAGGPPCQGFSVQRRGDVNDIRNNLVFEFLRIVVEIHPRLFLMENVSAIAGPRGKPFLKELFSRAFDAGYRIHSKVLDAADYGVPQHRKRMFLIGESLDAPSQFCFPSPTHTPANYKTVRTAIADLPKPGSTEGVNNHEPDNISDLNRRRIAFVPPGGGREHIPSELRLPCHSVSVAKAGHRNVYGRLAWDLPSGTITTKCNSFTRGKFAHPRDDRNISMREAARLQSFPDDFVFCGNKVAVAHQVGNAVPPLLAQRLGESLIQALVHPDDRVARFTDARELCLDVL